ncbi:rhomboid family intramembrane serine protease [Bacteroidota bacterium]
MNFEDWVDIVPSLVEEGDSMSAQRARIWSLVLSSQFIDHRVGGSRDNWTMWVRSEAVDSALEQITAYEQENLHWIPTWLPARTFAAAQASFLVLAGIAVVHAISAFGAGVSRSVWLSVGSADAGLILRGEVWRVVTALTLHANVLHLLANVVVGGFFVLWLCKEIGPGFGWMAVLISGMLGNILNSVVQSPLHNSIGASTAVFGAIGILSGLRAHESATASRSVIVPLMSGIILLAFLGSGGEQTDVGAHLFGLISGVLVGALLSTWLKSHAVPGGALQKGFGIAAILLILLAWAWGLIATL